MGVCDHGKQRRTCSLCRPDSLYQIYKRDAEKRGLSFQITEQEFESLVSQPCSYCGKYPEAEPPGMGIDRIDARLGYVMTPICNVCPCCKRDNGMKSKLSRSEYIEQCKKVARHQDKCSPVFEEMDKRIKELEAELSAVKAA